MERDGTRKATKREIERARDRGGGKEGSYADIETALESLNVIRLKGF